MTAARRSLLRVEIPFAVLATALMALAFLFAAIGMQTWIPPALTLRFGVASPLSGMTRSFVAFASGDLVAAFRWHPLGPLVFAACAAMPVIAIVSWARGSRLLFLTRIAGKRGVWIGTALIVAIVWARQIASLA